MTGVRPNILVTLAHLSDLTPKPNEYDLLSLHKGTGGLWKDNKTQCVSCAVVRELVPSAMQCCQLSGRVSSSRHLGLAWSRN